MIKIALITSTISPGKNAYDLHITDSAIRLEQYKKAFSFYLNELIQGTFDYICYVDNSGHPLDELISMSERKNIRNKVTFFSYCSLINSRSNGRFYLEINLLDTFFKEMNPHSLQPETIFWKITGRYTIVNIREILEKYKSRKFDLCLNYRNHPARVIDFYLAGMTTEAYKEIFSRNLEKYGGEKYGESILRSNLESSGENNLKIIKRFSKTPYILGQRGLDGANYGTGKDYLKYCARSICLKTMPFLWV